MTTNYAGSIWYRIGLHFIFWLVLLLALTYHGSLYGGDFRDNLINIAVLLPIQVIAAYTMIYWQVPTLLFKKMWLQFAVSVIFIGFMSSVIARLLVLYLAEPLTGYNGVEESIWEIISDPIYLLSVYLVIIYIPTVIFFLIKMTRERFTSQMKVELLQKEKRTAELNYLKAQMNPHFLFNTLNNIYSLTKSQSERAPEMILKLSDILNYTIYECQAPYVLVTKEWQLIENYIDLQIIRYSKPIHLLVHQKIDNSETTIAPLILITIVENAFKYALQASTEMPSLKINLSIHNRLLNFMVKNSMESNIKIKASNNNNGIGIYNLQKQLDLIYPQSHTYQITTSNESYEVHLTINL